MIFKKGPLNFKLSLKHLNTNAKILLDLHKDFQISRFTGTKVHGMESPGILWLCTWQPRELTGDVSRKQATDNWWISWNNVPLKMIPSCTDCC